MEYTFTQAEVSPSLQEETGLPEDVLRFLTKRGFTTTQQIDGLLYHDFQEVLTRTKLQDMDKATHRIISAVENKEQIVIYSDYDCDGCCSGSLAVETLRALKTKTEYYMNQRSVDGYGLCINGINKILEKWPKTKLIITVDNGILAYEGIAYAKSQGLDVIVTDHHEANEQLPEADAIINPKRRDETYPMREICGTTVIFKVMLEVYRKMHRSLQPVLDTVDLVAIATVADVMPMLDENRAFVREGLKLIGEGRRPLLRAFLADGRSGAVDADTIGFQIAPMINAVSRMDADVSLVFDALLTKDEKTAFQSLKQMKALNEERKGITRIHSQEVSAYAAQRLQKYPKLSALILHCPDIPSGIVGIVAGHLCGEYKLPTIILTDDKGSSSIKGSARSCDGFNLKDILDNLPPGVLNKYGGHALAAGLSLDSENFNQFYDEFLKRTDEILATTQVSRATEIDLVIREEICTPEYIMDFQMLEPYGHCFPAPLFGLKAAIKEESVIGNAGQHLRYVSDTGIQILKWNFTHRPKVLPSKFVGSPRVNTFRGETRIQFITA